MTSVFHTSDMHLGHEYMAHLRGFASVDDHDKEIVRRWNSVVHPADTVWVHGDAVLGLRTESLDRLRSMHGTKHLISGNHDSCWPGHSDGYKHIRQYLEYFETVQPFGKRRFGRPGRDGTVVLLSHFPYTADHVGDVPRYMQYRLRNEGEWLWHGHTHSEENITSSREIHVGMDAWDLTPVKQETLLDLMNTILREEKNTPAV